MTALIISLPHLIFPSLLFIAIGLMKARKEGCLPVMKVLFFPVATMMEMFLLESRLFELKADYPVLKEKEKMTNNMAEQEKLTKKMEECDKKMILLSVIEVASEASFQFYLQTLLALPQVFLTITSAIKSQGSLVDQVLNLRMLSILFSFAPLVAHSTKSESRPRRKPCLLQLPAQ